MPPPSGSLQTWGDPELGSEDRDLLPSKCRCVPTRSRDWGPSLRAYLELCSQQFYASALQPSHPSYVIVLSPFRSILQASYTGELEVTTPTPPSPSSLGACEKGSYHLARRLSKAINKVPPSQSEAPNRVIMAIPPPVNPTEQLLPCSHRTTALS